MNRWKQIGIPALAAGCVAVIERGCKTVEAFHTLDFITHLNESPTLGKVQQVLGTRPALIALVAVVVVLAGAVVRRRQERGGKKSEVAARPADTVKVRDSANDPTRRVRTMIEQREEVHRTTVIRTYIEEDDP